MGRKAGFVSGQHPGGSMGGLKTLSLVPCRTSRPDLMMGLVSFFSSLGEALFLGVRLFSSSLGLFDDGRGVSDFLLRTLASYGLKAGPLS